MNSMQQEMQHQRPVLVRQQIINVEQESVKAVFEQCPDDVSRDEAGYEFGE